VGRNEGERVGFKEEGAKVGRTLGRRDGFTVGVSLGRRVGFIEGERVVGRKVGILVGFTEIGAREGFKLASGGKVLKEKEEDGE
jgi:hypothetical protein